MGNSSASVPWSLVFNMFNWIRKRSSLGRCFVHEPSSNRITVETVYLIVPRTSISRIKKRVLNRRRLLPFKLFVLCFDVSVMCFLFHYSHLFVLQCYL